MLPTPIAAQTPAPDGGLPTIADYTRGMDGQPGYFPLYWDDAGGRLLLEVGRWDEQFLYLTSLATGVGSNALGLDRGNIQSAYLAHFERVGPKVLLVLDNPGFRAETNPTDALVRSVEESFLTSTVGGFAVVAEEDGRALVDGTSFFLRDVVGVAARLQSANQGSYRLDANRSAIFLPRTKAFPENTEVEASLTFESERPGGEIQRHAPDGRAMTLRQHHSLVMLPDDGYTPRRFDPRIGVFAIGYYDFGKPSSTTTRRRWRGVIGWSRPTRRRR